MCFVLINSGDFYFILFFYLFMNLDLKTRACDSAKFSAERTVIKFWVRSSPEQERGHRQESGLPDNDNVSCLLTSKPSCGESGDTTTTLT